MGGQSCVPAENGHSHGLAFAPESIMNILKVAHDLLTVALAEELERASVTENSTRWKVLVSDRMTIGISSIIREKVAPQCGDPVDFLSKQDSPILVLAPKSDVLASNTMHRSAGREPSCSQKRARVRDRNIGRTRAGLVGG